MFTISDTMIKISLEIQDVFEELLKSVLRKTLQPILNPLNPSNRVIDNPIHNINGYTYILMHDCLGWTDDCVIV